MSTEDPITFGPGPVWLDPETPQNFTPGRNPTKAHIITSRASVFGWHKAAQRPARLDVLSRPKPQAKSSTPSVSQSDSAVSGRRRATQGDERLAVDLNRRSLKRSGKDERPQNHIWNDVFLRTPSPVTVLQHGGSDPFHTTPVDLTAQNYHVVESAFKFTTPAALAIHLLSKSEQDVHNKEVVKHQRAFFWDEAGLHALICSSWSVMSRLNPAERDVCLSKSLKHGAKAMQALRRAISRQHPSNEELVKMFHAVAFLLAAALFVGDRAAAMYHQDACRRLIELLGGVLQLAPIDRYAIIYILVRIALNTRTRTVLAPAEWDPVYLPVLEGNVDSAVGPTTAPALLGRWEGLFVALKELTMVEKFPDLREELLHWRFLRRQAIKAKVANMWCDMTEPTNATDPVLGITAIPTTVHHSSLDMCLCLAVQNYIVLTFEPATLSHPTISSTQIFHIMLIRCLRKVEVNLEQPQGGARQTTDLLWVLGIGAVVEMQMRSQLGRPSAWINYDLEELKGACFMLHFGLLAMRLGYERYEEVAGLFERDYVYPSVQEQVLRGAFYSTTGLSSGQSGEAAGLWSFARPLINV